MSVDMQPVQRRWPSWLRRGPMEMAATAVIAIGVLMLLQPFLLTLYTWSFITTLAGTVLFMVVSKFPD
jgi:VIT1/CCC1 family predicted Fe2+/Mn2+ transporter